MCVCVFVEEEGFGAFFVSIDPFDFAGHVDAYLCDFFSDHLNWTVFVR